MLVASLLTSLTAVATPLLYGGVPCARYSALCWEHKRLSLGLVDAETIKMIVVVTGGGDGGVEVMLMMKLMVHSMDWIG